MKQRYTFFLSIFCAFFLGISAFAQPGNNCNNALEFDVNINGCEYTQVTNEGLSNSGQAPVGDCPGFAGGDLWIEIELPPSGEVTTFAQFIPGESSFLSDVNMAAYFGPCNSLTQIGCDDDSGSGFYPSMTINGTPGATVYLQFWETQNNNPSPFNLCINGTATCASPTATFTEACGAADNTFEVDVNITDLGDASEVSITDGTTTFESGIVAPGMYTVGPFALGAEVTLSVVHAEDATCNVSESVSDVGLACANILTCGTPLNQSYCYGNNDNTGFLYTSPSGSEVTITFDSGLIQSGNDFIRIYDGTSTAGTQLYSGSQGGDLTGLSITAPNSGSLFLQVNSDIAASCQDGSLGLGDGWNWNVACEAQMCDDVTNIVSQTTFAQSLTNANLSGETFSGYVQCDGPGGSADAFYTFTAVGSVQYIRVEASGDFDPIVEVYDDCDGAQLACVNDAPAGQRELFWLTDLNIGQQYAFRVYNNGGMPASTDYTVAVAHIPSVQLRAQDCGSTGLDANSIIRSTWPNPNYLLEGFVWEFTELEAPNAVYEVYSPNGANPNFIMQWFTDFEYGRSYSVRIKPIMYQGPNEGEYGQACTITMAGGIVSGLQPLYNNGFYNFCDVIKAIIVQGATNYRWEFENNGEIIEVNTPSYPLALNNPQLSGLELGTSYNISVYVTNGGTESETSLPGVIHMNPSVDDTSLNPAYLACGSTVSTGGWTQAFPVCAATQYTFRFTNLSDPEAPVIEHSQPSRTIAFYNVSGLMAGDTYNVAVRADAGGLAGDYSTECQISFLGSTGLSGLVNEETWEEESTRVGVLEATPELSLYPNPVTDDNNQVLITISDMTSAQHEVVVRVYDMTGRLMTNEVFGNNGEVFNTILNLDEEYATGIYLVTSTVDGQVVESKKLIVE